MSWKHKIPNNSAKAGEKKKEPLVFQYCCPRKEMAAQLKEINKISIDRKSWHTSMFNWLNYKMTILIITKLSSLPIDLY